MPTGSEDSYVDNTGATTLAGWIDPLTGTLGKLTDIYVELQNQKTAGQAYVNATAAQDAAAKTAALAAQTTAATQAAQWIPGVSNTTLVVGGVAIVGLVILLGLLRK